MSAADAARFSFEDAIPETATIRARAAAFLVDIVLTFIVTLALAAALVGVGAIPPPDPAGSALDAATDPFVVVVAILEAPVNLAYFTVAEARWGRTAGKVAFGLRVVSETGGRPTLAQSGLRNLLRFLWFVPILSVAFIAIDWYLMVVGELDQRIGDVAGRTFVVADGRWWPPRSAA